MKSRIFWFVFCTVFLRVQIYEAIAAIFWRSASYVAVTWCFVELNLDPCHTNIKPSEIDAKMFL